MKFHATRISGLFIAESTRIGDERGHFMRLYCGPTQEEALGAFRPPVQINHSYSRERGTLRGMHFQRAPALEAKTVRCLHGRVWDVAVDLREGSPTFLQHHAVELSAESGLAFVIPEGFAHGFQTLTDDCELLYLHSTAYDKAHEGGLRHDDPALAIDWPLPVSVLSERDKSFPLLDAHFHGITHAL